MQLMDPPRVAEPMPEAKRRELTTTVVAFLRSPRPRLTFTPDDAAATCSRGYSLGIEAAWQDSRDPQPPSYDLLVRRGVLGQPKATQYEPEPGDGPSPRESQRFEDDVARVADSALARWEKRWPRYLRLGVPSAVELLSPLDQEIVDLCGAKWMSFRGAADLLGLTHPTVSAHYAAALDAIVAEVWDEEGAPRFRLA